MKNYSVYELSLWMIVEKLTERAVHFEAHTTLVPTMFNAHEMSQMHSSFLFRIGKFHWRLINGIKRRKSKTSSTTVVWVSWSECGWYGGAVDEMPNIWSKKRIVNWISFRWIGTLCVCALGAKFWDSFVDSYPFHILNDLLRQLMISRTAAEYAVLCGNFLRDERKPSDERNWDQLFCLSTRSLRYGLFVVVQCSHLWIEKVPVQWESQKHTHRKKVRTLKTMCKM